jgi:peptidoglycan/LPS O-acetylase OafA/YrhL
VSSTHYRTDIQGLRAIAVLAVIAFHFNPAWLPGGFIGVDVFLVVSGFLITTILLNKRAQPDNRQTAALYDFYASRFKRIVPAYFAMLVIVALLAAVFFLPSDFDTFKNGLEKAAWFNSNSYFAGFGDYFAPAAHEQPLLHTWSLAVEIQFYLLAPFMVLLLPIRWLKWVFAALLVGLTSFAEYRLRIQGIEQTTYYSLYARLPEFFAGGLAALYTTTVEGERKAWLGSLGMVLIALAAVAQPFFGTFPGVPALLPVAGSVLMLSKPAQGWAGCLLSNKTLVWIGALSYSLYLWHWPVLAFLRYYTGAEVLSLGFSLLFILLTLLLSIASYYGVERAFRSKLTTKKRALGWALLTATVFGTSQAMAKVNAVFTPERLPIEYQRYADPATICHGKIIGDCLRGDLSSDKEVLVLGDSHAAMLNHFFDYMGKELGFKARIITGSNCVTIPGFDYRRIAEWAHQPCLDQIEAAEPYIKTTEVIFLAGVWNTQTRSEHFNKNLKGFINSNKDKHIVILSQVPRFNRNINRLRRFQGIGLQSEIQRDSSYQHANNLMLDLAQEYEHVEFKPLSDLKIFEEAPYYKGKLIYKDEHHINKIGAIAYGEISVPYFLELTKKH